MRRAAPWAWCAAAAATLALTAAPRAQTSDHQYSSQDIEAGARIYSGQCALCHAANGDGVDGVDLRRGRFRTAVSDEDLSNVITTGIATAGMPGFRFQPQELTAVIAYIRAGFDTSGVAVKVGNPARGKALYDGKGQCATCHRVNGMGSRTAPDLSDIGAIRSPTALQRALLDPTGSMFPINRPVRAVTRDGRIFRGRRLNEDTYTVQIMDEEERLVSLEKKDLREYQIGTESPMPADVLKGDEVADMIAYLLTLKGL